MAMCTSTADAQFSGRTNPFGSSTSMLGLMQNARVQNELKLNDEQKQEIGDLNQGLRQEFRELVEDMRGGGGDRRERFEELRSTMKDATDDYDSKLENVLSKEQLVRSKQLHVQSQLANIARALAGSIGEQLGLEKADVESVADKAEEVKKWEAEQIAKIRAQAREKIISVLPKESREKLNEMTGEYFDFGQQRPSARSGGGFRRSSGGGGGQQRGRSDF